MFLGKKKGRGLGPQKKGCAIIKGGIPRGGGDKKNKDLASYWGKRGPPYTTIL